MYNNSKSMIYAKKFIAVHVTSWSSDFAESLAMNILVNYSYLHGTYVFESWYLSYRCGVG